MYNTPIKQNPLNESFRKTYTTSSNNSQNSRPCNYQTQPQLTQKHQNKLEFHNINQTNSNILSSGLSKRPIVADINVSRNPPIMNRSNSGPKGHYQPTKSDGSMTYHNNKIQRHTEAGTNYIPRESYCNRQPSSQNYPQNSSLNKDFNRHAVRVEHNPNNRLINSFNNGHAQPSRIIPGNVEMREKAVSYHRPPVPHSNVQNFNSTSQSFRQSVQRSTQQSTHPIIQQSTHPIIHQSTQQIIHQSTHPSTHRSNHQSNHIQQSHYIPTQEINQSNRSNVMHSKVVGSQNNLDIAPPPHFFQDNSSRTRLKSFQSLSNQEYEEMTNIKNPVATNFLTQQTEFNISKNSKNVNRDYNKVHVMNGNNLKVENMSINTSRFVDVYNNTRKSEVQSPCKTQI